MPCRDINMDEVVSEKAPSCRVAKQLKIATVLILVLNAVCRIVAITASLQLGVWPWWGLVGWIWLLLPIVGFVGALKSNRALLLLYLIFSAIWIILGAFSVIGSVIDIILLSACHNNSDCKFPDLENYDAAWSLIVVTTILSAIIWIITLYSTIICARLRRMLFHEECFETVSYEYSPAPAPAVTQSPHVAYNVGYNVEYYQQGPYPQSQYQTQFYSTAYPPARMPPSQKSVQN